MVFNTGRQESLRREGVQINCQTREKIYATLREICHRCPGFGTILMHISVSYEYKDHHTDDGMLFAVTDLSQIRDTHARYP